MLMKSLSVLFALCALFFTAPAKANTTYFNLQLESYYSNAPGYEHLCCTTPFGSRTGDTINVTTDFYLTSLSVANATLLLYWYIDTETGEEIRDFVESGPIDADSDFSWLNTEITLPPGATGRVYAEFTIDFVDGSYLGHFAYTDL